MKTKKKTSKTAKTAAKKKQPHKKSAAAKATRAQKKNDIVELILADHKPLKKLIKIMKNDEKSIAERRKAFADFGPLLMKHAKPEEQVLYTVMKADDELRVEALEGDVEHGLADQMVEEAKRTKDDDLWSARVKVLAELVEHHIEEEEDELLPDFKKHSAVEERISLGEQFLEVKENIRADGSEKIVENRASTKDERDETRPSH